MIRLCWWRGPVRLIYDFSVNRLCVMMTDLPTNDQFLYAGRADRGSPLLYVFGTAAAIASLFAGLALLGRVPAAVFDALPGLHLFSYLFPVAAVLTATRLLHGRPMRSVLGPWPTWRQMILAMLAGLAAHGLFTVLASGGEAKPGAIFTDPVVARLALFLFAAYGTQVLAEEVLSRGYMLQGAARVWSRPAVAVAVSAVLFGLLHVPGYFLDGNQAEHGWLWKLAFHLPWAIVIGGIFGVWAVLGGNIWLPTLGHLMSNAGFLLIDYGPQAENADATFQAVILGLRPLSDLVIFGLFTLIMFPPRRQVWSPLIGQRPATSAA